MQNLVWTKQGPTLISNVVDPPRVEFITCKLYKTESLRPVYRSMVLFKKEKHHNSFHKATSFVFLLMVIDEGDETYMIMRESWERKVTLTHPTVVTIWGPKKNVWWMLEMHLKDSRIRNLCNLATIAYALQLPSFSRPSTLAFLLKYWNYYDS